MFSVALRDQTHVAKQPLVSGLRMLWWDEAGLWFSSTTTRGQLLGATESQDGGSHLPRTVSEPHASAVVSADPPRSTEVVGSTPRVELASSPSAGLEN